MFSPTSWMSLSLPSDFQGSVLAAEGPPHGSEGGAGGAADGPHGSPPVEAAPVADGPQGSVGAAGTAGAAPPQGSAGAGGPPQGSAAGGGVVKTSARSMSDDCTGAGGKEHTEKGKRVRNPSPPFPPAGRQ